MGDGMRNEAAFALAPDPLAARMLGPQPTLCVSLIVNDPVLAREVEEAGADGIKLHLNLNHPHANVTIGSLEEEADSLAAVIDAVSVPVGIVPRGSTGTTPAEVEEYARLGFAFIDLYSHVMAASLLSVPGIGKWVAPKVGHVHATLEALSHTHGVDVVEASFLPQAEYGAPLAVDDLVVLRMAMHALGGRKPLVLPTDRRLTPEDVPVLVGNGIDNLLIGYAVTGAGADTVPAATERFRRALDGATA